MKKLDLVKSAWHVTDRVVYEKLQELTEAVNKLIDWKNSKDGKGTKDAVPEDVLWGRGTGRIATKEQEIIDYLFDSGKDNAPDSTCHYMADKSITIKQESAPDPREVQLKINAESTLKIEFEDFEESGLINYRKMVRSNLYEIEDPFSEKVFRNTMNRINLELERRKKGGES